ncbi:MAG TPA: hypothetical protein VGB88_14410 [Alphaproteobacteria bacterium]
MHIRCAYFEGEVAPEMRARFDRFMDTEIMPRLTSMPKVRAVRLLRGEAFQDGAPGIYQTIEQEYDSIADIEAALASEVRREMRDKLTEIMPLFKGRIWHINHRLERFL